MNERGKMMKICLIFVLVLCFLLTGCGKKDQGKEEVTQSTPHTETETEPTTEETTQEVPTEPEIRDPAEVALELSVLGEEYGYKNALAELSAKSVITFDGDTYYRFGQNFKGIPVYGRTVVYVADENGEQIAVTQNVAELDGSVSTEPTATKAMIANGIRSYFGETMRESTLSDLSCSDPETAQLVIYYDEEASSTHLGYRMYFFVNGTAYEGIVDAHSGRVLHLGGEGISGVEVTAYVASDTEREKGFFVEQDENGSYVLMDGKRGIVVRNMNGNRCDKDDLMRTMDEIMKDSLDVVSANDVFGDTETERNGKYELAAEYLNAARTAYDWYKEEFSFTPASGRLLLLYNDMWSGGSNAGASSSYYQNNPDVRIPIITYGKNYTEIKMDVIAHEYTHVVSNQIVEWSGSNALEEGLCDIFATIICWYADGKGTVDWTLNGRNKINPEQYKLYNSNGDSEFCRYEFLLKQPCPIAEESENGENHGECLVEVYYPECYGGDNWYPNTDAHVNSVIISHATYLMWNGIDGDTSKKVDMETLAKLWYRTMLMMPSDCDFVRCRELVLLAAESMELNDAKIACIEEAFAQVGLGEENTLDYKLSPTGKFMVYGANGEPYDNYTYHITGNLSGRVSELGERYEETVVVSDAEPRELNLYEGFYTFTVTDNADSEESYVFTVHVDPYHEVEEEIVLFTSYGSTSQQSLAYEMRTGSYMNGTQNGEITYPYFLGNSPAELAINGRYALFLELVNSGENIYPVDPRCTLQWGGGMFGFFKITCEVTYNKNGAISIKETFLADYGGAHMYHVVSGLIYENASGKELKYGDILSGSQEKIDEALLEALEKVINIGNAQGQLNSLKEYTGHALTEDGLCFYYNIGDAIDRAEVVIPFTFEDSYIIFLDEQEGAHQTTTVLDGTYRQYYEGFYVEYAFTPQGTFSFDMVNTGNIDAFDRDYGTGTYTVAEDVLTLMFVDGDHPGEVTLYRFALDGDELTLYFEEETYLDGVPVTKTETFVFTKVSGISP